MKRVFYLFIILTIISCGNVSLETDPIVIKTVANGDVLKSGDYFNITFDKISDTVIVHPDTAAITISFNPGRDGITAEPLEYSIDLIDNPAPKFLITDDFIEGLYSMNVKVYEKEDLVSEFSSEFIVFNGELTGDVSNLYPYKDLYTNSKVILESSISASSYIDPYLVWSHDGVVFTQGYLSEGLDTVIWDTGESYGFIDIKLELYPYKLESINSTTYNFIDFSFAVNPITNQLFDSSFLSQYLKVLFFNGNYIDENNKTLSLTLHGEMKPLVLGNFFGMEINKETGFTSYDSIFKQRAEDGIFESSSLIMEIIPVSNTNGNILYAKHNGLISTVFSESGLLYHEFGSETQELKRVLIGTYNLGLPVNLIISFVKDSTGFTMHYYLNGQHVNMSDWDFANGLTEGGVPITSYITLGGSKDIPGFNSVLDLFMVYYQDSNGDNNIFNIGSLNSAEYILFEDFTSILVPENLIGVGLSNGETLEVEVDSVLSYPLAFDNIENFLLEIKGGDNIVVKLYNQDNYIEIPKNEETIIIDSLKYKGFIGFDILCKEKTFIDYIKLKKVEPLIENK
ncbi:MAG: hypothetical protein JXR64_05330 [Spirochaetales bacterium]|nr:hypothetical protein [Spirochaetales bacterium]